MQYDKIFSYIDAGKQAGAKCVLGGEKRPGKGYYVDPTSSCPSLRFLTGFPRLNTRLMWHSLRGREARHENSRFQPRRLRVYC